jgi:hypothetical protein
MRGGEADDRLTCQHMARGAAKASSQHWPRAACCYATQMRLGWPVNWWRWRSTAAAIRGRRYHVAGGLSPCGPAGSETRQRFLRGKPVWEARWINGVFSKEVASNLFKQSRFKHRSVHQELFQFNWIKKLVNISSEEVLDEFFLLFHTLSDIQLSQERDSIAWKWTSSGEYTAASAYEVQFLGAYPTYRASTIWTARVEPRCRFFAWLAIQGKAPTTDNLLKKNWPCDPECSLCFCMMETNEHLLTECNFTEAVWDKVVEDLPVHQSLIPFNKGSISNWLEAAARVGSKKKR